MADGFDFTQLPTEPRARLAAALAHLEALRDDMIAELDRLEGDPDLEDDEREDVCEDEGGACEDEGHDSDREADYADHG
ncbi:MAG: hypothetical protein A2790_12110 [Phenylobacterium sp. RIFCSPHIGHO2_01_FULL_69_31]|uniref:hypothetical protein n=1 Tax=Phenylobacterium sp. RIFCSPHIGHO2_01_FULL_69_31 TaxID=1801944 RepID=UPI0008C8FCA7|nr:hypothetical protein [Phenylobacterium sp. RIFCSPHIGHO2_01_FULL_69_31]OHB28155.1 MAG: hypothetical protein A2790_12110 [Phenylobacterium sp. RIFCSPHIGHO2_01_FULL_69_31]